MPSGLRIGLCLAVITAATHAQDPTGPTPPAPAEESRLNRAVFRAGLKSRGLTELLELHVRDFPPTSEIESLLMMREVKLAEAADPAASDEERRSAVRQANDLLERVIEQGAQDPRRFEWRFALAHSLIYDEAEPMLTALLYRGGPARDCAAPLDRTDRAVRAMTVLLNDLSAEYERVDKLSIPDFEKLERGGFVERLDRLTPRAEYLLVWARFYDALPRDDADPVRAQRLHEVLDWIAEHPATLTTPHETSQVQIQTLLLAGMANRLLNRHDRAREHLDRAITVAEGLEDPVQRRAVDWAVALSWLERIRNDAEDGRFEHALTGLQRVRDRLDAPSGDESGMAVVAALVERWVYAAWADASDREKRPAEAARHRDESLRAVVQFIQSQPHRRAALYAAMYDLIGPDTDPARLDPVEQCALLAGLLGDADRSPDSPDTLLDRAVTVGERFLTGAPLAADALRPEVLYNVAVAQYRRGRPGAAAERFLEVAEGFPSFDQAPRAAAFAVQLAAELYGDLALRSHPEVPALYRRALEALLSRYGDTDAARYWRFYYAQLLDEQGQYDLAAAQYALVDEAHEHYLDGLFHVARCLALSLQAYAADHPSDRADLDDRTDRVLAALRTFASRATAELGAVSDAERTSILRHLLARGRLLTAEVLAMPHAGRSERALEMLADFEEQFPGEQALAGGVWRVRLLAYEELDRLDEATQVIPRYVNADPDHAGPVLQSLYEATVGDVAALRARGDSASAQRKAQMALVLAQQIHDWVARSDAAADGWNVRAAIIQLAEANLWAGQFDRARELFGPLLARGGQDEPDDAAPMDARVLSGHAEAMYQLRDFAAALPEFNRLAVTLPPDAPARWEALLRDLQCRTALHHPPQGIIQVISQQRQLHPELGGPVLSPQFEKLYRENERRLHDGS